jgi:hypothetical protein
MLAKTLRGAAMTLEQASFIAQIVSALAVIASLIFVGVQLRQAIRPARSWPDIACSTVND